MARVAAAVAMLPVVLGGGSLRANMGADTLNVARNVSRPLFLHTIAAAAAVPVCCTAAVVVSKLLGVLCVCSFFCSYFLLWDEKTARALRY